MPFIKQTDADAVLSGKRKYIPDAKCSSVIKADKDTSIFGDKTPCNVPPGTDLIFLGVYKLYVGDIVCELVSYDNSTSLRSADNSTLSQLQGNRCEATNKSIKRGTVNKYHIIKSISGNTYTAEEIIIHGDYEYYIGESVVGKEPRQLTFEEKTLPDRSICYRSLRSKYTFNDDGAEVYITGLVKPVLTVSELLVTAAVNYPPLAKQIALTADEYPRYVSARILAGMIRGDIKVFENYDPAIVLNSIITEGIKSKYVCLLDESSVLALVRNPDIEFQFVLPIVLNDTYYVTEKMIRIEIAVVNELWHMIRLKNIRENINSASNKLSRLLESRNDLSNTIRIYIERIAIRSNTIKDLLMVKNVSEYNSLIYLQNLIVEYSGDQHALAVASGAEISEIEQENKRDRYCIVSAAKQILHVNSEIDSTLSNMTALKEEYRRLTTGNNRVKYDRRLLDRLQTDLSVKYWKFNIKTTLVMDLLMEYALIGVKFTDNFINKQAAFIHSDFIKKFSSESRLVLPSLDIKIMRRQSAKFIADNFTYEMLLTAVSMGVEYLRELHKLNLDNSAYPFIKPNDLILMAGIEQNVERRNVTAAVEFFASTGCYFDVDWSQVYYAYYDFNVTHADIIEKYHSGFKFAMLKILCGRGRHGCVNTAMYLAANFPRFITANEHLLNGDIADIIYRNRAFQYLAMFSGANESAYIPNDLTLMVELKRDVTDVLMKRVPQFCVPNDVMPNMLILDRPYIPKYQICDHSYFADALQLALGDYRNLIDKYQKIVDDHVVDVMAYGRNDPLTFEEYSSRRTSWWDKSAALNAYFANIDAIAYRLRNVFTNMTINPISRRYIINEMSDVCTFIKFINPFHSLFDILKYRCEIQNGQSINVNYQCLFWTIKNTNAKREALGAHKDFRYYIDDSRKHIVSILYEKGAVISKKQR